MKNISINGNNNVVGNNNTVTLTTNDYAELVKLIEEHAKGEALRNKLKEAVAVENNPESNLEEKDSAKKTLGGFLKGLKQVGISLGTSLAAKYLAGEFGF